MKGVVLSVVGREIKKIGLSGVSGYFCFYILLVLRVLGLAISEFLPYAGGYKLVLHLLLVIRLSCYYSYEVSSWIGNLS